jgi:predicted O-methyltransferase YrrM
MTIADSRPDLAPADIGSLHSELGDVYGEYTRGVSPDNMAVSLETATYFLYLCRTLGARSVADFGSGFSSYVVGLYASEAAHDVDTVSVDDDPEWLAKTAGFLGEQHVYSELMSWEHYKHTHHQHDVALYDLGNGEVREAGMELVARRTKSGGVVLFDDAMHEGHRNRMQEIATKFRWDLYFLHEYTMDKYGRFTALLVKP